MKTRSLLKHDSQFSLYRLGIVYPTHLLVPLSSTRGWVRLFLLKSYLLLNYISTVLLILAQHHVAGIINSISSSYNNRITVGARADAFLLKV